MSPRPVALRLTGAALAVALATTACTSSKSGTQSGGSPAESSSTSSMTSSMNHSASAGGGTSGADTAAATLRAGLDELFHEHVNLTGFAVQTAVMSGIGSANTSQALAALDGNTVALGKAIGSVYGGSAEQQFLTMWRAHIGFFVDYTKGLATSDTALMDEAQRKLAGYKQQFATFLGSATGLPASAVAGDLQGHITTLEAAIKAIVTKDPSAAAKISAAQSHMAGTAAVLAKSIATQQNLS